MMIDNGNFISRFINNAESTPNKIALQLPQMEGQQCTAEDIISYGDLSSLIAAYKILWQKKGWQAGDRVVVILKPSKELYAIAMSLFSLGIVAVFIDTGMGRKKIQMAVRDSHAKAIISMQALVKLFWFVPALWPLQRFAIDGSGLGYSNILDQVDRVILDRGDHLPILTAVKRSNSDHGLISFTSGSTGRPKGADRTHFSLIQQHLAIRDHWQDAEDDIDCPCFPVMVLHNLSCGMTTIMPKVDLAQPSEVNAGTVIEQLRHHKITRLSGAPAYISKLVDHLAQQDTNQQTVTEVTSLVVGGATVSRALAEKIRSAFPNADARIVYGSTEAEPISDISIDEYLLEFAIEPASDQQTGYLVGHIASQVELLISDFSDLEKEKQATGELITEDDLFDRTCAPEQVGEILVSGNHVLKQYIDNPLANQENKIRRENVEESKAVWHRTGDCGYRDKQGRLWLSGRIKDVIKVNKHTFQPYPIEQKLDWMTGIARSAVLHHENNVCIFIQRESSSFNSEALKQAVVESVSGVFLPFGITFIQYIEVNKIPVDGRHNSKIDRPKLCLELNNNAFKEIQLLLLNSLG
jgi:acyl-CoA synthetase (AMP-forming)/AMP-acid ligase II